MEHMKRVKLTIWTLLTVILLTGCGAADNSQPQMNHESENHDSESFTSMSETNTADSMAETAISEEIAPIPFYQGTLESCILQEDEQYLYFCGSCRVSKIDKNTGDEVILWENAGEASAQEEYVYSRGTGLLLGDRIYFIEIEYDLSDNMYRALSTVCTDGTGYERIKELKYSTSDVMYLQNGFLYVDDMDGELWFQVYEDGLLSAPEEQELDYFKKIYYADNGERVLFQQQALEEFGYYIEQTDAGYIYSVNPEDGTQTSFPMVIYFKGYNDRYLLSAAYPEEGGLVLKLLERDGLQETTLFEWKEWFNILGMDEEYVYVILPLYEEGQSVYSYEKISLENGARELIFEWVPSELTDYYTGGLMDVIIQNGYIYYVEEQDYSFYRMRRSLDTPETVEILGGPVYETGIGFVGSLQSHYEEIYSKNKPEQQVFTLDLTWLTVDDKFPGANLINSYLYAQQEANMSYAGEHAEGLMEEGYEFATASSLSSEFSGFSYFDNHYISFVQQEYAYHCGAAHGMPWWIGHTFDLETGERLLLPDIMYNTEEELKEIVTRYFAEMINECPENYWVDAIEYVNEAINLESDFYLTEEGIKFYFGPYELACYAAGFQEVTVPYEEFDLRIILENAVRP